MSTFEIKMPKLGESITEGTIVSWSVKVGDAVQEDDVLFEVSTAKVSAEIPSPVAGKVLELLFAEGDTVAVGTAVALIQLEGEEGETQESSASAAAKSDESTTVRSTPAEPAQPVKSSKEEDGRWYSPIVLQLAQEAKISQAELDAIPGTGYEGRLSKKDIKDYITTKKSGVAPQAVTVTGQSLTSLPDSGEQSHRTTATTATGQAPASTTGSNDKRNNPVSPVASANGDEIVEMDRIARILSDHMVMSKKVSPHVTTVVEADVTRLVKWRSRVKEAFFKREGVPLTYMPAIAEATAKALAEFPYVNASVDGYKVILKKHINLGIAVSLPDGNLIVPVIHDADKLNLNGLAGSIDSLAAKARSNKLMPDDIQGGTFTITNFGSFKSLFGTPIINQPQVAILGVGFIEKKPAVVETPEGDTIAIRHKMYLSLSYDHRIINGALGGEFLRRVADYLENWDK
ncbi:2-oxo acid dehydrogenase acyltransferase (catalytic domain) [Parabacteroides johnsonii DSM 18315]|uniref:Dihydrolipoamide acetyltransferase component of pyruvate dehydrogenase complex n=1 Tax=Parabacteroides johnsonii DSM 18315 TaxID=537006 RepID=B7BAY2_9BACT|nr:dihydrolipoamide acetyltransferase family protein [Parabacteroides johnsonii]EEC96402.1 2-oxo acid dehydrogenase acyltransferase (catalytic domain) [Parabacteroides johnsonii DSM 18315]UEA92148.1 2-oxo acid dehydrogenase subunit E2 [Parabacteroides johnsonii]UWP44306.1 2-oxo acid dehydrogenase subunit E2 [Parabacteroides johnsonii DSM 18315]HJG98567.1 2-oxo acid dehydrogenase subunit E2 [Parabacteroides johnsonii]